MKKFLIGLVLVVVFIALLPIIGNSFIQNSVQERLDLICENGVEIVEQTRDSGYLKTKSHYEFVLRDAAKFVSFINQYSDAQIPPYIQALVNGVKIGVDLEHSNFPIASKIALDIYPIALSQEIEEELKEQSIGFYSFVDKLLRARGVLYHINYNISENIFDGFVKDLDEKYLFDNGNEILFKLLGVSYYGEGSLIAPSALHTNIKEIDLSIIDRANEARVLFELEDLQSSSTFNSQSTYASSASLKSFLFTLKEHRDKKISLLLDELKINLSSNTQGKTGEFYTKMSLKEFNLKSPKELNIKANDMNYDIAVRGVDKDSYEELRVLTSQLNTTAPAHFEQELQRVVTKLLSNGLSLHIPDISIKKVAIDKHKAIDGFSFISRATLGKNPDLVQSSSPQAIVQNLNLASTLKISSDLYAILNQNAPLTSLADSFAKKQGDDFVFELKLNAGVLSVNDMVID